MKKKRLKGKKTKKKSEGKLGLALSGGGFRASFFHIGVLAQMARFGLLRHVEVISTVSGGSIIGALYYLHLKKLLEEEPEGKITDQHYIEKIKKIEHEFLRAVQRNIRMRTFCNPIKNIKMSMASYSRSDRIGELYDKYFYRNVLGPNCETPIKMRDLKIKPEGKDFYPPDDNAKRKKDKVPIILINATTLNAGHNWRFEASHMGEPSRMEEVSKEIDKNLRLLRPSSYEDITKKQQNFELGLAVAASACVPLLFPPLAISGLYPDDIRVQLVDGGIYDNQGIQGLIDEGCTKFVVSDASGQIKDEPDPSTGVFSVLPRTNSILMERMREEQMIRLFQQFGRKNIAFIHIQKGLPVDTKSWIGPDGKPVEKKKEELHPEDFGVSQSVQSLLSCLRTDLDSFTEVEANSLMLDGYLISRKEINEQEGIRDMCKSNKKGDVPKWKFLAIAPWISNPTPQYKKHLEVGSQLSLKLFRIKPFLSILMAFFGFCVLIALWIWKRDEIVAFLSRSLTVGQILYTILYTVVAVLLGFIPKLSQMFKILRFLRRPSELIVRLIMRGLLPAVGAVFVWIHLLFIDPPFLSFGQVRRLRRPSE